METILLLTGASGFIGRAVARAAATSGQRVIALDRKRAPALVKEARAAYPDRPISLLHLAWPSLRRYSARAGPAGDDDREWRAFLDWQGALARAAADARVAFFQAGSGVEPYALCAPPQLGEPYLGYARRKEEAWRAVKAEPALSASRLRIHFVFGPGEADGRLAPAAIRACRKGAPFEIGALTRMRRWLHVDDLAAGLLRAVAAEKPQNWDICGTVPISFSQLLDLVESAVGAKLALVDPAKPPADAGCPDMAPENLAPFLPQDAGGVENLRVRLHDYVRYLDHRPG